MGSLQRRLAWWLVGSVLLVLALHWPLARSVPRLVAEQYVASRLEHDAETLLGGLRSDASGRVSLDPAFVAPAYEPPLSGHYYVITTPGGRLRSRSLGEEDLPSLRPRASGAPAVERHPGPGGRQVLLWASSASVGGQPVQVLVAEDLTVIESHVDALYLHVGLVTLGLLVALVVAQRALVRWTLRPLERVREDCRRLVTGEVERLREDVPAEVQPLVAEVNRLLRVMGQRTERSRLSLANLAHAVKTPLTVLTQALRECEGGGATDEVIHAVERIQGAVTRELRLTRLGGRDLAGSVFIPAEELPALIGLLRQAYRDRNLDFQASGLQYRGFRGDREDMLELFGNLLDNAAKWARSRVLLTVLPGPGLAFLVEDDGPGVSEEDRARLPVRGVRLNDVVQGQGIGLAVCREVVDQYGGTLTLSSSPTLGGLRVEVRLPP